MKYIIVPIFILVTLNTSSCGKNGDNEDKDVRPNEKNIILADTNAKTTEIKTATAEAVKKSILTNKKYKLKKVKITPQSVGNVNENSTINTANAAPSKNENTADNLSFFYIKKILEECEIGVTFTQSELSENYDIPKDAIKLVKSIKKIADDEVAVKWKSTWLIDKVSDAQLTDGHLKVYFRNNKMYTSGNAIGIKFNDKMYTDLVITGSIARIPSVKGFYWKIGKD